MKVVIAIDGQASAETAFDHVLDEKYGADTEFHLVHVLVPGFADVHVEGIPDVLAQEKKEETVILNKLANSLRATVGVGVVTTEILPGETAEVISDACKRFDADRVVVPSHARHGFSRLWFGSVADEIVDAAPCTAIVLKMPQEAKH